MTTKTEKLPVLAQRECLRFQEFKDFLLLYEKVGGCGVGENVNAGMCEQRNCMTRNTNETYPVTTNELKAELIMAIWNYLKTKRCPYYFQLSILRALLGELEPECRNTKEHDFKHNDKDASDEVLYDLAKLQKFVANSIEKFLTRLTDNTEAGNLRYFADKKALCEGDDSCQCGESLLKYSTMCNYVVGHIKNKPRKMEDRHVCLERFSELYELKTRYSFYGVFDGHSGPLAANYASSQLPYWLSKYLKEENQSQTSDFYREALESAFLKTDRQFSQKAISSGTTAVCALISLENTRSYLYVAWVGDSQALLVGKEASLQLVKSHKPDSPEERKRIEDAGGSVMHVQGQWRVNGFLNVARSIGDYSMDAVVIAEPDFVDIPLTKSHDFLVLGTDGLWDHVTEAVIITTIYEALENEEQNVEDIPKMLIELAKKGDSQDNITVVIVFLKERKDILRQFRKGDK